MVWDEIKRILMGVDEDSRSSAPGKARRQEADQEIGALASPETEMEAKLPGDVAVTPFPGVEGEGLTVQYEGTLARQGAVGIDLHCGFGDGEWSNVQDVAMTQAGPNRWQATVFFDRTGRFNFCFRDSAGNWDNRGGENWYVDVVSP